MMPATAPTLRTFRSPAEDSADVDTGPVRVCFIIDELATAGTETQLLALIRRLDRRRVEPHLCLLRGDSPVSRALEPADCPVIRLGIRSLGRLSTLRRALRFIGFLRHHRIEVLQAFFPDSCYFGLTAAWFAGVPHRLRTRNNIGHWLTPLHRFLGRLLNRITTRSVTNCRAAAEALLAAEGPPPESVVVLANGVDLDRFQAIPRLTMPPPGAPVRVGAIANLRPVKGLDLLVEAAGLLTTEHPDIHFEVAGEGNQRPLLETLIEERGLGGRFRLPGALADVAGFLARTHVAVLCSHAEGMSNALLEYMAAGRAVVATAVGAAPELIADGRHGLLVPPGDAAALAEAIARLLREPELAVQLGQAARRRARQEYSREAMVQRFEDFYEHMARPPQDAGRWNRVRHRAA
jgi:glycosyltransferase involved in cell wall biosynthesis